MVKKGLAWKCFLFVAIASITFFYNHDLADNQEKRKWLSREIREPGKRRKWLSKDKRTTILFKFTWNFAGKKRKIKSDSA